MRSHRHQYGVTFLALAEQRGVYGDLERVLTQREMRALDNTIGLGEDDRPGDLGWPAVDHQRPPFGVQLDPDEPTSRRHYPDVMLIIEQGRVAIEVQVQPPERRRLEQHIAAYGADPNIAVALYLVTDQAVGRIIKAAAAKLELSDPIHVKRANFGPKPRAEIAR